MSIDDIAPGTWAAEASEPLSEALTILAGLPDLSLADRADSFERFHDSLAAALDDDRETAAPVRGQSMEAGR